MSLAPAGSPWTLTLAVLIGCGTSSEPTTGPPSNKATSQASVTTSGWLECTESVRAPLEALLLARHHLDTPEADTSEGDAPQASIGGLKCVTVQLAKEPAFFVELVGASHDKRRRLHGVVATDRTTELVTLRDAPLDWAQQRGGKVSFETTDLDGDHIDEIVVHHDDRRQTVAEWIDVIAIRDHGLVERTGPRVSYDDPDIEERCHGVLRTEAAGKGRHLVVTTTDSTGKSEHCLANGRHVFALEADELVEL